MMMRLAVVALVGFANGRFLAAPSHTADQNATHKNVTVVPMTDEQKLANLQHGLMAIKGLKAMFQSDSELSGGNQFAQGALSNELSKDNSGIWDTINTMMAAADEASKKMKSNATAAEKAHLMDSLESNLDVKAEDLNKGLGHVNEHQQDLDEEYVLGLLIMHQKDWTVDQQLNATLTLKKNSPLLEDFYKHHDSTKPLAAQLAALMDKKKASKASAVPVVTAPAAKTISTKSAPKVEQTTSKSKSAKVAAKLFLQLASSFREI